jgi:F0F1-type ATP synthase assembly protein I
MVTKFIVIKYIVTAAVVVAVSEFAKANGKLGGLIAALPLVTVLALIWLYVEKQPMSKISNHAYYTFWYVIPTLPMFLLFPYLLPKFGFWPTLLSCIAVTLAIFYVYALALKGFGIDLL